MVISVLRLTVHMMIADMKKTWRRGWFLAPVLLGFFCIIPFVRGMQIYAMFYMIILVLKMMIPHFSRIYHIVPLSIKKVKEIFLLRIFLNCLGMSIIAAIVILVSEFKQWNYNVGGVGLIIFYMIVLMILSENSLQGFGISSKFGARHVFSIILMLCAMGIGTDVLEGVVPFALELGIMGVFLLLSIGYMLYYLKDIQFEDYKYVSPILWDENGVEKQ